MIYLHTYIILGIINIFGNRLEKIIRYIKINYEFIYLGN